MSIVGIGTDIIEIERIVVMSDNTRDRLAKRVLTPGEYQYYVNLQVKLESNSQINTQIDTPKNSKNYAAHYLAKRWAGKEATSKALGTGIADGVSFQHIEIQNLETGQPTLILSSRALDIATGKGASHWHISLADEKHYATAFVTLSKGT